MTIHVTKNDYARIAELRMDPGCARLWYQALGTRDRGGLDAAHSHASEERDAELNAWFALVAIFNNRFDQDFNPQNRSCIYRRDCDG